MLHETNEKTYYNVELPDRFLEVEADEIEIHGGTDFNGNWFHLATAMLECTYEVHQGFHHKDECFNLGLQIIPIKGELQKFPFSEMTDDELETMLNFITYDDRAKPGNLLCNKRAHTPFFPSGLFYECD